MYLRGCSRETVTTGIGRRFLGSELEALPPTYKPDNDPFPIVVHFEDVRLPDGQLETE